MCRHVLLWCVALSLVAGMAPVAPAQPAPQTQPTPDREAELKAVKERIAQVEAELADLKRRVAMLEQQAVLASDPRVVWTTHLLADSKGGGQLADLNGDGRPEIVFGTYFNDERVYALNATDGKMVWTKKSDGGPFDASVAIADLANNNSLLTLVADSATGKLFCLKADGVEAWALKLPSGTDSPPAIGDVNGDGQLDVVIGTMWRQGGLGTVCAINPATRQFLWQTPIKGCVQSEPALTDLNDDGALDVIVTSWRGDRGIHALDGKTGAPLWSFITAGNDRSMGMYHGVSVLSADTAATSRLFAATCDGDVYCLNAKGEQQWHKHVDDYLFAPTTLADFTGDGVPELLVAGRRVYLLNATTGETIWTRNLGGSAERGGVAVDWGADGVNDVVIAAKTTLMVLEGKTGDTRFELNVAKNSADPYERISSAPLVFDLDADGTLEAFVVCGRGYSGDLQPKNFGRALLIRLGKGRGDWPVFRGNLRRTGHR